MRWKKRQLEEQFPEASVMVELTRGLNVQLPGPRLISLNSGLHVNFDSCLSCSGGITQEGMGRDCPDNDVSSLQHSSKQSKMRILSPMG